MQIEVGSDRYREIFGDRFENPFESRLPGFDVLVSALSDPSIDPDQIEEIRQRLPGLDCGSCGSPTCQALAEDIVAGEAREMDCLFLLKERVRLMAKQMVELSETTREK